MTDKLPKSRCVACGEQLPSVRRSYCWTEQCAMEYARQRAYSNVDKVGECEVWKDALKGNGQVAYIYIQTGKRRGRSIRAIDARAGDGLSKHRQWENLCGTKGCIMLTHNKLIVEKKRLKLRIDAHLPIEPLVPIWESYDLERAPHMTKHIRDIYSRAKKQGYITVTNADTLCIDGLRLNPVNVWGDEFFDAK